MRGLNGFVDNLGFSSLQLHDGSQLFMTLVLGYLIPSSGLWCTDMLGNKTPIQQKVNLTERGGNHSDMSIGGLSEARFFQLILSWGENTRLGCLGC